MRGEQGVLELSKNIISYLTKYVHGDVGVFYLLEEGEGEPVLKLAASYAYIRRKNISKEFHLGEGLIGQAALEKEAIVVSEMEPDDDLRIASGTAVKPPKTIVVQPFILNRKLIGVFEIGSTESFTSHEIRTPMNAIVGFADLMKDLNLSVEERNMYAEIINTNSMISPYHYLSPSHHLLQQCIGGLSQCRANCPARYVASSHLLQTSSSLRYRDQDGGQCISDGDVRSVVHTL